jgi:16S rRNA (adenine1518-N6/adenine1519-N6)-dimethyltransferase
MDLSLKKDIKNLLKDYQIRPLRGLGQNFLVNKEAINRVIKAAELNPRDIVLEIGPGLGSLTQELAKKVKMVIAVEKDPKMVEILNETLKGFNNVEIIKNDILKIFNFFPFPTGFNYKIVGNLPFYLTAPVIRQFLEGKNPPRTMVLVIQKEVGQRICAKPGKMSILAVSVQVYAEPEIISYISKKSFWPQPKVDSAIVKITPYNGRRKNYAMVEFLRQGFFRVVKAGFSQPRKQLINNLTRQLNLNRSEAEKWLLKNNIKPIQRAETLSIEDWLKLTKSFKIE